MTQALVVPAVAFQRGFSGDEVTTTATNSKLYVLLQRLRNLVTPKLPQTVSGVPVLRPAAPDVMHAAYAMSVACQYEAVFVSVSFVLTFDPSLAFDVPEGRHRCSRLVGQSIYTNLLQSHVERMQLKIGYHHGAQCRKHTETYPL